MRYVVAIVCSLPLFAAGCLDRATFFVEQVPAVIDLIDTIAPLIPAA
jgi:hypothetical protein